MLTETPSMPNETSQQPWLHDLVTAVHAPTVVLGGTDGQIRGTGASGVLHADVRVLSEALLTVNGEEPTPITGGFVQGDRARFSAIARSLGDGTPDPTVRLDRLRTATADGMVETLEISSAASSIVHAELRLHLSADFIAVDRLKSGHHGPRQAFNTGTGAADNATLRWTHDGLATTITADGARVEPSTIGGRAELLWNLDIQPGERHVIEWHCVVSDTEGPVVPVATSNPWAAVTVRADERRLAGLVEQSIADLSALRMAPTDSPADEFLAAGSPWYFTLFGRDSIWAARLMLPFGTDIAAGTLRALAARQGTRVDTRTAEAPGKIPHEVRRHESQHEATRAARAMSIPPLYYGTVDATPLWISLLHDAWRWGLPETEVRELLPAMQAALGWLRDYSDPDGDGFIEYLDESGTGLANQGWKDSGDSIRFADGTQADGAVALCEVQGYAHAAALHGAQLLDAFGLPGAAEWRQWAADLETRFRASFWVSGSSGRFPALALDGAKRPVDSLTSNIGHLLGTGILDHEESALVASHLRSPALNSGFGLRTMSAADRAYSPLSYHCGSVWPHDTAIAIRGLAVAGQLEEAFALIEGLLAAAGPFDNRLPELYAGDASADTPWPAPYPASCRPQAWSAAAAGAILEALMGLIVDVPGGTVRIDPPAGSPFGAMVVEGVRVGGELRSVHIGRDGTGQVRNPLLEQGTSGLA